MDTCPPWLLSPVVISLLGLPQHLDKWDSMWPCEQVQASCRTPHHGLHSVPPSASDAKVSPRHQDSFFPAHRPTPLPKSVGSQPLPVRPPMQAQGRPLTCHQEETHIPRVGRSDRAASESREDREGQREPGTEEG